jgi:predicted metal-dependent TIM-barrel fold hydrolase
VKDFKQDVVAYGEIGLAEVEAEEMAFFPIDRLNLIQFDGNKR